MTLASALVLLAAIAVCSGQGNSNDACLRFGGGSCCPVLDSLDLDISQFAADLPGYAVIFPANDLSTDLDNVCVTVFPVPDDFSTYVAYMSSVYCDNSIEVETFILSGPEVGVFKYGNGICQFTDTAFAELDCARPVYLSRRCTTFGDCDVQRQTSGSSGVFAFSTIRGPVSIACLNNAIAAVRNNGLPTDDDFYILPQRLPSQCVLNQVCTVSSTLQRFCQTVGVAFPAIKHLQQSLLLILIKIIKYHITIRGRK